jgi:hypothetical protein
MKNLMLILLGALAAPVFAADWEAMKRTPAQIEVVNMQPMPLVEGTDKKGWARVPAQLTKHEALIFTPTGGTNGVADIKVLADGFLMVACNYDYQGNSQGKWDEEDWNESYFKKKGWRKLSKTELGGILVKGDNREQTIFVKQLRKGDNLRIRCNKYDPPFPIVLPK